ncbi:hypothetical protein GCM10009632_39260 [Mycolicibacterium alvei]|uniref:Uncharacterized protein n=1 Tax=Mycolicibacterium alvei TaxID=67081 RepID=A0A6N4UU20_9MYCO|nr:hypothetical protein MALV_25500 [Mycolicibacterium alvei]
MLALGILGEFTFSRAADRYPSGAFANRFTDADGGSLQASGGGRWVVVRNVVGAAPSLVLPEGGLYFGDIEALVDADAQLGL